MKITFEDGIIKFTPEDNYDCYVIGEIAAKAKLPAFSVESTSGTSGRRDLRCLNIKKDVLIDFLADHKKEEIQEGL